jgi:TolB-like protein
MNRSLKVLSALALLAAPVAAQNTPIVTVLAFDNASFGPGAKDYDGIGKGVMDLVITDLASGGKLRVVDRARVQAILDEQKLTTSGAIDPQTAVKVGRLLGACYSVYGTFMRSDKTGQNVLTIHATSNETGEYQKNPVKLENKGDDILDLIAKASAEFAKTVDVKACAGNAGARRSGDASPAQQGSTPAAKPASNTETYAKGLTSAEVKKLESPKAKLDARTMLLYSRALDAKDKKETARAKQLAEQVVQKYPEFVPATQLIAALNSGN